MERSEVQPLRVTRVIAGACALGFLASCATPTQTAKTGETKARRVHVRTTAYTAREPGGTRNAIGRLLSGNRVMSAASDWSRFPLGTRFRIVGTSEEYEIDDYGGALIGTNTIDLYKTSTLQMRRWGVRHVDIDILKWGSEEESLKMLAGRGRHAHVRRMMAALNKKNTAPPQSAQ